jgi:primosomal protein N' (replication factor Y)
MADPSGFAFAQVVIDSIPLSQVRTYTYRVPADWLGRLRPGMAVLVPLGPRNLVAGYIAELVETSEFQDIKMIEAVIACDDLPLDLTALIPWLSQETLTPFAQVWMTVMPRGTLSRLSRWVALAVSCGEWETLMRDQKGLARDMARCLADAEGPVSVQRLKTMGKRAGMVLAQWRQAGWVREEIRVQNNRATAKMQLHACLIDTVNSGRLSARQAQVLERLRAGGGVMPLATLTRQERVSYSVIAALKQREAITVVPLPTRRLPVGRQSVEMALTLNAEQAEAVASVTASFGGPSKTFLLHGVTGSGKTEVYLQAIAHGLRKGFGAIVLVPEIALTPQTLRRFVSRFGDTVAVLHSQLSEGERFDEWQRIRTGDAQVVVGARSAVFAPIANLGLIVIDEEHESSYKQDQAPRYHARQVALERARLTGASLVLGSATPDLETYARALKGEYTLLAMPRRVNDFILPPVAVVDMRQELKQGNRSVFSRQMVQAIEGILSRQEQAILLINRRGYSSFVFCRDCGGAIRCERCSVSMTYHQSPEGLQCHYCGLRRLMPRQCATCSSVNIRQFGAGTQQIEEAVRKRFPQARVLRVDRDTTRAKGAHEELLDAFGRLDHDILVGTQMIAKGLDFPNVSLVGVMAADGALHLPDYRASERTFQLLTQVSGRAGRAGLSSQVIVQTYCPEHPAIVSAAQHDYATFYAMEMADRECLGFPPFVRLVHILCSAPEIEAALGSAVAIAETLSAMPNTNLYGPHAAPLAQLNGLHRVQMILKTDSLEAVVNQLRTALHLKFKKGVRVTIDIDPHRLL